jgi:transcription antitermination factor NusG
MSEEKRKWYVVYTKPRWEKKVFRLVEERGIQAYCPLNRTKKQWSDRVKWIEEPVFKSYVFIRVKDDEMTAVRMINGVVNFVYWLGKPAVVKDREIEVIRKFLDEYEEVLVEPVEVKKDTRVTIRKGAFMDKEAKVMKVLNNRVQVVIESIGFTLIAVVDKSNIAVTGKK